MARMYKIYRPYSDPDYEAICVLCHKRKATDVFFPCEHRCVCRTCIQTEQICDENAFKLNPNGYCNCSLCAEVIKIILPFERGLEVEKYWQWVYQDKIEMPAGFMKNFRHSAAVIKAVYMDSKEDGVIGEESGSTSFCAIQ